MTENPLSVSALDNVETESEDVRTLILGNSETISNLAELKRNVEARKRALAVAIEQNKADSTQTLAESLAALDDILTSGEVLEAVKNGIINSKDPAKSYSDFAKASTEIYNRMMKQQLSSADPEKALGTGKNIKVAIFDNSGTTMVEID